MRDQIILEILAERAKQDVKWGGAEHDDTHNVQDFVNILVGKADLAAILERGGQLSLARHRLIQVAATAMAAVEQLNRKTGR